MCWVRAYPTALATRRFFVSTPFITDRAVSFDLRGVQHVNHQVESIDDLMRSWYWLQEQRVPIVFGPGRHPTSGARFLYFAGPDEMVYEYSTGVRLIAPEEEATYRPRQFPFEPKGFCMWGSKPQIVEFQS